MILNKEIEIIPASKNVRYFKDLGYEAKRGEPLKVKIEDLSDGCHVLETRQCDNCLKPFTRAHRDIIVTLNCYGKDLCVECTKEARLEKSKNTNLKKYGVEFPMQSKEIKEKAKKTTRAHYGVDYSFQDDDARDKAIQSFKDIYQVNNPQQLEEIKEKTKQTNLERYGVENVFASDEIKEKIKQVNIEKFGVDNPMKNKEIVKKARQKMKENGNIPTSKIQVEFFNFCKKNFPECEVELNYPVDVLSLDILMITPEGIKIDIEYDGWYWHQNKKKDYARDVILKEKGYKIIRVRAGELLPSLQELKKAIAYISAPDKFFAQIVLEDWIKLEERKREKEKF